MRVIIYFFTDDQITTERGQVLCARVTTPN